MEGTNFDFGRHLQGGAQLQFGEQTHPSQPFVAFSTALLSMAGDFGAEQDVDAFVLHDTQVQFAPQQAPDSLLEQEQLTQVHVGPQQHEYVK
jgi:hypothetical protein